MARAQEPSAEKTGETAEETAARLAGKGRATPTRKERESARKRPLVPDDRSQARKEARAKMAAAREKARVGMAAGDERYLPVRDKGPQKRYIRDFVDARFSIGELLIPMMLIVILLTFVPSLEVQFFSYIALYAYILLAVVDSIILGFLIRRRLAQKFGADKVERGVKLYAAMRALQFRRLRLPKPQVKRGQYPA
ncbi:DUF3043 domain-containing protein [Lysobacter korlensis]|uniref:DUF3043 domain-containing protein n=1 Tax=Lysobacter korlensis TaxID=553636 RepID=A0ABV6RWY9_9GAMM